MLNKMSDAQRSMLQAAAVRDDRLLTPPAKTRTAVVVALADKLIDAGCVKEIRANIGAPVWRKDPDSGQTYALKLTAKGRKAAAAMMETADGDKATLVSATPGDSGREASAQLLAHQSQTSATAHDELRCGEGSPPAIRAPRPNSKIGRVLDMLATEAGATIGELTTATGWLEHTTRAALTGLRHRGYELRLTRKERDGASVYRIVAHGEAVAQ
jgi:hypothetical protein